MDIASKNRETWINELNLEPHVEGGYFSFKFGSEKQRKTAAGQERRDYSCINFMVTHDSPSRFHVMDSDEIWHYHAGAPLTMHVIDKQGDYFVQRVGLDAAKGEMLSVAMKAGWIFGATVEDGDFTLVSCTVVPGFDERDYRLLTRAQLIAKYPHHSAIIDKLAYEKLPD
jgi:predicted cupin superfamily sugar epimerase